MLFRLCTSLDLPAVAALHISIASELRSLSPEGFGAPLESLPGAGDVTGKFRDLIDDRGNVALVAEDAGRIVGFANGWREEHDDDLIEAPFLTIEFVEVHPDYRGRGIARQLVGMIEAEARQRGLRRIDLLVMQTNEPALKLYKRLGYLPLEVRLGKVLSLDETGTDQTLP
ncbi:MAG: GNAT family N-acetyltransferase [bacterium]|nr:GNAT family N-acetyltransferase [bacterium]